MTDAIQKSETAVVGSVASQALVRGVDIATALMEAEIIALVDISGSMDAMVYPQKKTRWQIANNALISLQNKHRGKVAVVEFNHNVALKLNGVLGIPTGGTELAAALEFVSPIDGCGIDVYIISDGLPNSELMCFRVVKEQLSNTRIFTVYCGDEDEESSKKFLNKLASLGGGQYFNSEEGVKLEEQMFLLADKSIIK